MMIFFGSVTITSVLVTFLVMIATLVLMITFVVSLVLFFRVFFASRFLLGLIAAGWRLFSLTWSRRFFRWILT